MKASNRKFVLLLCSETYTFDWLWLASVHRTAQCQALFPLLGIASFPSTTSPLLQHMLYFGHWALHKGPWVKGWHYRKWHCEMWVLCKLLDQRGHAWGGRCGTHRVFLLCFWFQVSHLLLLAPCTPSASLWKVCGHLAYLLIFWTMGLSTFPHFKLISCD